MNSRSSKGVVGLLKCPLRPYCRTENTLPLRRRNVIARFKSDKYTDDPGDSVGGFFSLDDLEAEESRRRHGRIKRMRRVLSEKEQVRRQKSKSHTIPISVRSLGDPAQVVVIQDRKRRRRSQIIAEKDSSEESKGEHFMLKELEKDAAFADEDLYIAHIDELGSPYQPYDKLTRADWNDLRYNLRSSFKISQLSDYIQQRIDKEGQDTPQGDSEGKHWLPGVMNLMELVPKRASIRTGALQGLKGKDAFAEKILRDCWHLSIAGEVGQLDIPMPDTAFHTLLNAENFSFEELAVLHDVKIDVSQVLQIMRVTGRQEACESIRDIVRDATMRIKEEGLTLPVSENDITANARVKSPDFLSWLNKTYGVTFDGKTSETPRRMFYLAENKQQADDAHRTLHLAWHSTNNHPTPFSTYMPATEMASINNIDPELNTPWFDRRHSWFRWAVTHETGEVLTPGSLLERRKFFNKHQFRLSNVLLKLLRNPNFNKTIGIENPTDTCESVTAAVGKCLFLRKPTFEETSVSAPQLGRLSLPRTFATDIPRAAPFLNNLVPQRSDEQQVHRIRLVPSAFHAQVFPQLEVEVTVNTSKSPFYTGPEFALQSAKVVLAESKLDFLLPENGLDLRFSRRLTHELPTGSAIDPSLGALEESLGKVFRQSLESSGSEVPLPSFTQITLPRKLLGQTPATEGETLTADYIFLPVNDARGTRVHRYNYGGQQLNYSYYESGPFLPHRVTELFLRKDIGNPDSALSNAVPGATDPVVEDGFHEFYKSACNLAFDVDMARQTEAASEGPEVF